LIPIVPSYGGCSEIVPKEYQYTTIEDAAERISNIIYHYDMINRKFVYGIAKKFSPENFTRNLKSVIDQTYIKNKHGDNTIQKTKGMLKKLSA
jgi:hypothetical protein